MSRSRTPTLPWVLPMYEYMRKHLRKCQNDATLPAAVRGATEAATEKLEEYYSKACGCQFNIIATRTYPTHIVSLLCIDRVEVLHPSFGIAWFRKMEAEATSTPEINTDATETGPEPPRLTADRAKILFEHAYTSYSEIHGAQYSQPTAAPVRSTPGSFNSFLDDICMVDVADTAPDAVVVPEIDRFWNAFKGYNGDPNNPLKWWKVSAVMLNLISCRQFCCRNTRPSSSLSRVWPATFWRSPAQVSPSSACSRVHATSAARHAPR